MQANFIGTAIVNERLVKRFFDTLEDAKVWFSQIEDRYWSGASVECIAIGTNSNGHADGCGVIQQRVF